ncbi:septal ring lytic transglycosylase RlpA family protein [Undibacterium pigrum]|uniref:Endolytic peptidoglycan transglycosylase RlpA n=1 Tax=Undibacterium pigrum TaxID=401470 RepID=A0A318J289_9BURK|nr:septal ring lytic transglycosylase RlpA family protein [Undibacterium pigrum]PXX41840.1 rare lipoprotein A [Undibacterium pigrum]
MSARSAKAINYWRLPLLAASGVLLAACGSAPKQNTSTADHPRPASGTKSTTGGQTASLPKANSGKGAYYKDDGPGENIPEGLENTVDPIPTLENYSRSGNKPYVIFGKTYTPIADSTTPFIQRGVGSWYGKKFHGQKTSSGELYDMYKITAAHPILPIPSYARVTNISNGKQIIVRINDRGPFHASRIIDLSYTAALKLDVIGKGSSQIEVERLLPADIERMAENRKNQPVQPVRQETAVAVVPAAVASVAVSSPVPAREMPVIRSNQASMTMEELLAAQDNKPVEKFTQPVTTAATTAAANNVAKDVANNAANAASAATPGYYIQFGAYAIRANAEAIMNHLKSRATSKLPGFDIVQQGSLYRLVSGPFANRTEASAAIVQATDLGVGKPLVVQR